MIFFYVWFYYEKKIKYDYNKLIFLYFKIILFHIEELKQIK